MSSGTHRSLVARTSMCGWALTSERFLLTRATYRVGLANESHWTQLMLLLTAHWCSALVSVGGLIMA